jgi:hypothetical protein
VLEVYKWVGVTFAIGVALMIIEVRYARKKKEGFTHTDKQRVVGIFWLTLFFCGLVGFLVWAF